MLMHQGGASKPGMGACRRDGGGVSMVRVLAVDDDALMHVRDAILVGVGHARTSARP